VAGSLRSFRDSDRDGVLALSRHALARGQEQVGVPLWASREDLDDELTSWAGPPGETLRVVEEDGEVAAFGGIRLWGQATVVGPLVGPQFRGRKIGTALLDWSIELSRERGAHWMLAAVGVRNLGGRLLLERRGFRSPEEVGAVYRLRQADHRPAGPAPPGIDVRAGGPSDLERIYVIYGESGARGRRTRADVAQWLEEGEVTVAERAGDVVAFVHLDRAARWLSHVDVATDERGLGVGGYLFSRTVEDYWRDRPDGQLRLSVIPYDTPAIRLYRRLGFAPWLVLQSFEREL
jgi:GNAT superfamily N-acetyltransferase